MRKERGGRASEAGNSEEGFVPRYTLKGVYNNSFTLWQSCVYKKLTPFFPIDEHVNTQYWTIKKQAQEK